MEQCVNIELQCPYPPPRVVLDCACDHRVCSSVLDPTPIGVGGSRGGGGFSILGEFFNSPFHSEHFEYTQVG